MLQILGCYEQPLQPFIEMAFARQYSTVITVIAQKAITRLEWQRGCPALRYTLSI